MPLAQAHPALDPRPLDLPATPADVVRAWPVDRPVAAVALDERRWVFGVSAGSEDAAAETLAPPPAPGAGTATIGWLAYELGAALEPAAGPAPPAGALGILHRCPLTLHLDRATGRWTTLGDRSLLAGLRWRRAEDRAGFAADDLASAAGRERYTAAVARAVAYIHAGDVFQVNLSHAIEGGFRGSARAWAARMLGHADPRHGGYIERFDDRGRLAEAVCSISPELLVSVDGASRRIVARPIKGTRPAGESAELVASSKDAAELAMIVDLMRNDLGRVCELGSIRVETPRAMERHGAPGADVVHGVATVAGRVRGGVSLLETLRAVFPAGSITGAPKIRAMQIIRELEGRARGAYCGSLVCVEPGGGLTCSVAIRTATLACDGGSTPDAATGRLAFPVGAGIVAESDPGAEWDETLAKAATFLDAMRTGAGGSA